MSDNTEATDKDKRAGKLRVKMSKDQIADAGEHLASKVQERNALDAKKSTHVKEWNEQLRQLDDEITELAEAVEDGMQWVDAQRALPGVPTAPAKAANGKAPAKKAPPPKAKSKAKGSSAGARV